jgi:hypothetical protein
MERGRESRRRSGSLFAATRSPSLDEKGASAMGKSAQTAEGLFRKILFPFRNFYVKNRIAITNHNPTYAI